MLGCGPTTQDELKQLATREALKHVVEDAVVGVGSGSICHNTIAIAASQARTRTIVPSSAARGSETCPNRPRFGARARRKFLSFSRIPLPPRFFPI